MKRAYHKLIELFHSAKFLRKFHGWSFVIWFIAAFPICIFLNQSIPFLVWISVYAIVVSHLEGWQTAVDQSLDEEIVAD